MRKQLLLIALWAGWALSAIAQTTPPASQTRPEDCERDTVGEQIYYKYQVEKSIGLYRISVNFGVSQEELIRCNPELRERGLRFGEVILIPAGKVEVAPAPKPAEPEVEPVREPEVEPEPVRKTAAELLREAKQAKVATQPHIAETVAEQDVKAAPAAKSESTSAAPEEETAKDEPVAETPATTETTTQERQSLKLALLLPLQANATQRDDNMERFLDFYEGALLAIHDVQLSGQQIDLYVYDIEKTDVRVAELIADSLLSPMDAIIGPAYPMQVMRISELSKEKHIPTLIPFTDQVPNIDTNPYLLQFNPSDKQKAWTMGEYLTTHIDEVNCVLVDARESEIPASIQSLRDEIKQRGIPHTTTSIHAILTDSLGESLRDGKENILIFNTEKYSSLQVLMPRVLEAKQGRNLTLYSQFSWQKEHILLPQLYLSVFATDVEVEQDNYNQLFDHYFGHEHSSINPRYDLLGYDCTRALLAFTMGKEYMGLQSGIHFEPVGEGGGYQNTDIHIIRK